MLFRLLSKFLASLLVSVLCGAIITTMLNQTVLNNHYLEHQLTATNSYSRLSTAISTQLTQDAGDTDPTVATKVQTIITPAVLQTKINGALDQLSAYYKGNGPVPTIDVSDLVAQANAAGLPINAQKAGLDKPITIGANKQVKGISKTFHTVWLSALGLSVLLVLALLAVSWERHRYAVLPDILITVGLLMGIIAAFFNFVPGMVVKHIKVDFSSNAFASLARDLATAISHDLGKRFAIIAGIALIAGIAWRVWIAKQKPKPSVPSKSVKSTPVRTPAAKLSR